jgi:hypothetical protein
MTHEKLIRMANQIAGFFATQPHADQAADRAAHINDFGNLGCARNCSRPCRRGALSCTGR